MKMYVVPRQKGWAVKEERGDQISRTYKDKKTAIRWAKNRSSEIMVQDKQGKFSSYIVHKRDVKTQHVVPKGEMWAVKCGNCLKDTKTFSSRLKAIMFAEKIAGRNNQNLVVHSEDGTIEANTRPVFVDVNKKEGSFWRFFR